MVTMTTNYINVKKKYKSNKILIVQYLFGNTPQQKPT